MTQTQIQDPRPITRTPLWRRVTALFTLSSMVIIGGLVLALVLVLIVLLALALLEQAIA